jgi:hypothetical protein
MGHRGSKKTQQQRLDPRDTCGRGQVVNGFHGDPTRGHRFWLYPREKPLVTERWDTHLPAIEFCKNHRKVVTGEYVCKGHIETEAPRVPSAGLDDDADDAPTKQKLATLAEMGFDPSSARRALDRHGGRCLGRRPRARHRLWKHSVDIVPHADAVDTSVGAEFASAAADADGFCGHGRVVVQ